jgi:hypothetical protein
MTRAVSNCVVIRFLPGGGVMGSGDADGILRESTETPFTIVNVNSEGVPWT